MIELTEQQLAEAVARRMYDLDYASKQLGIAVNQIQCGYSELSLTVTQDMLNGLGLCHGGVIFTLADSAFAFACNSRNQLTVALSCNITYTTAAKEGDVLTAIAKEQILNGRTGVYDVSVSNQDGQTVAFFRGNSYRTKHHVLPELS
jgi:acyl-CoA thioesterase